MYKVIIVPETHWDRAWYLSFQEFRIRLVKLFDKLLDILDKDSEYRCFVFDGQTVVLEDYLQVCPENGDRIRRYVKQGRIQVGPWYLLADEFLVSGEALVRNLLIGKKIAQDFGDRMRVGYVPDQFGHIAQLPQLLSKARIDSAIFSRGMGDQGEELGSEFIWKGLDGQSSVLAVHQIGGYCNASRLGYERVIPGKSETFSFESAKNRAEKLIERMKPYATSDVLLFNNGCDHVEPDPRLPETIRYLNDNIEGAQFVHADFRQFIDEVKLRVSDFKQFQGELRQGRYNLIIPGVYSSRIYLKQANERTQTLLEKYADPLATLAWNLGERHPGGVLEEAWKILLKGHPHDDICGCSIDEVHRDGMNRFEQAQQIGETIARNSLDFLAGKINTSGEGRSVYDSHTDPYGMAVVVFNPLPWKRTDRCSAMIPLSEELLEGKRVILKSADGKTVLTEPGAPKIELSNGSLVKGLEISFMAENVPSFGYKTFLLDLVEKTEPVSAIKVGDRRLENEFFLVTVNDNGSLNVLDKATGQLFENQNLFEDTEDVGDEYNYSPALEGQRLSTEDVVAETSVERDGPTGGTLKIEIPFQIPDSIAEDRRRRSSRSGSCPITVYVSLYPGIRRIDITAEIENNAKDHRLRALFPTKIVTGESEAETSFGVIRRSMDHSQAEDWIEKPSPTEPQESFVNLTDGRIGLTLINQGLPEYEPQRIQGGSAIALTLLRCVGWLSRDDLLTRRGNTGPSVPTPDAQCLGRHSFRYSLVLHQGTLWDRKAWRDAYQHNARLFARATSIHKGQLPKEKSFLEVSSDAVLLSAFKRAEDSEGTVVRLFNITPEPVKTMIRFNLPTRRAVLVDLMEEEIQELPLNGGETELELKGFEIKTIRFM